jgi:hypothetical protein
MIGCAIASSTSGGTGVGPGASKYFFNMGPSYRDWAKKSLDLINSEAQAFGS